MTMMSSCLSVNLNGSDYDTTPTQVPEMNKVTAMQPFDKVSVVNSFKVIYEQGTAHSVRIEASEQAFKEMTVYVKDGELRIRKAVKKTSPMVSFSDVKLYVTSPAIKGVEIAGSGIFTASNRIDVTNDLNIEIAGSGDVNCDNITADDVDTDIAGSGNVTLKGKIKNPTKEIVGSGKVYYEELKTE